MQDRRDRYRDIQHTESRHVGEQYPTERSTPQQSAPPCLTIYVVDHCELCAYALQMAEWIQRRYPQVELRVVNIGHTTESVPESVFAAPTYLLNGKVWSLGNPSEAQVDAAFASSSL